jgi:hypothetical protein
MSWLDFTYGQHGAFEGLTGNGLIWAGFNFMLNLVCIFRHQNTDDSVQFERDKDDNFEVTQWRYISKVRQW